MVDHDEPVMGYGKGFRRDGVKAPTGKPLPDMLDLLVDDWGQMAAWDALAVDGRVGFAQDERQLRRFDERHPAEGVEQLVGWKGHTSRRAEELSALINSMEESASRFR